jgi:alkanesulfonate monooxygenase SsuD/methylene tetrahydromethanopterin reductase-like flavin-dependent oxidoreductase (luciferase family)
VHDIVNLEGLGVPSVFVASSEFVEAADAQASALGADPARVFVPHPIQDRTDDELRALADDAVGEILAAITAQTAPTAEGT